MDQLGEPAKTTDAGPFGWDYTRTKANYSANAAEYPPLQAKFVQEDRAWNAEFGSIVKEADEAWKTAADRASTLGQPIPPKPKPPRRRPAAPTPPDGGYSAPGNLFNGMIAPLVPYAISGMIWYQGESNGDNLAEALEYPVLFPAMIQDWREHWQQGPFPFLYVQLANYRTPAQAPSEKGFWPWVREAQLKTLAVENTAMVSAIDVGENHDIHPRHKKTVGIRLALAARSLAYGEKLVHAGPLYRAMTVESGKIRLQFSPRTGGLTTGVPPWIAPGRAPASRDALVGFGIAGEDRQFFWAKAEIEGDRVVVSSERVPHPVAVRYDWADNPAGNLYNQEGLPASPFRTDDWAP